ncbi:hypothetical protein [Synechococcus sp. CBW1107]|uniref:hypothetical protein n=1 Tax=Synechococcus sp. CBW1107 TaxID=2789857 RepID=UPI002AD4A6D9|nr:hypothetical protein [Synechococcus sp. CBW1107]CAK6701793.1 hypothetical protein IFHNHDMJ_03227 [Synechococcus sp. CBW1107]
MNQRMIEEQIKTHIGRKRLAAKRLAQDSQHIIRISLKGNLRHQLPEKLITLAINQIN